MFDYGFLQQIVFARTEFDCCSAGQFYGNKPNLARGGNAFSQCWAFCHEFFNLFQPIGLPETMDYFDVFRR